MFLCADDVWTCVVVPAGPQEPAGQHPRDHRVARDYRLMTCRRVLCCVDVCCVADDVRMCVVVPAGPQEPAGQHLCDHRVARDARRQAEESLRAGRARAHQGFHKKNTITSDYYPFAYIWFQGYNHTLLIPLNRYTEYVVISYYVAYY